MKTKFQIWSEGYEATGDSCKAVLHGEIYSYSFHEACDELARINKGFNDFYDRSKLTYFGCKLFPNEESAKKAFG